MKNRKRPRNENGLRDRNGSFSCQAAIDGRPQQAPASARVCVWLVSIREAIKEMGRPTFGNEEKLLTKYFPTEYPRYRSCVLLPWL